MATNVNCNVGEISNDNGIKISLAWRNLRYMTTPISTSTANCCGSVNRLFGIKPKIILHRLNGYFSCRSLNGLMGTSGAGKTTLLRALRGIATTAGSGGGQFDRHTEIYLAKSSSSSSCFIEQHVHETIIPELTVSQILTYAYHFKNDYLGWCCGGGTDTKIRSHIDRIIQQLMLDPAVLDRRFIDCSGGEQKRIAIAQELMCTKVPAFLFVDEPTTGLDSNAALVVMQALKQLTIKFGITVITSIHVPNDDTLQLFDQLYVLAKGGVCIYADAPSMIEPFLARHQLSLLSDGDEQQQQQQQQQKPIEVLIKIACNGTHDPVVHQLADLVLNQTYQTITENVHKLYRLPYALPAQHKRFTLTDLLLHQARHFRATFIAKRKQLAMQILFYTFNILFLISMFGRDIMKPNGCLLLDPSASSSTTTNGTIDVDDGGEGANSASCHYELKQDSLVSQNVNYLSFYNVIQGFIIATSGTITYSHLVKVFRNEHRNKWYSVGTFFWSINIISLLEIAFYTVLVSIMSYFLMEAHHIDGDHINWYRFVHYIAYNYLTLLYAQSFGQLFGVALINHPDIALIVSTVVFCSATLFNDFFFKTDIMQYEAFVQLANMIGSKYITRFMLYTFYGIDRCNTDTENEFNIVMYQYNIDGTLLGYYVQRIVFNSIVLRLCALVCLYWKFATLPTCCSGSGNRKPQSSTTSINTGSTTSMISLDKKLMSKVDSMKNADEMIMMNISTPSSVTTTSTTPQDWRSQMEQQQHNETAATETISFEEFTRNRIILAWRNLTLYESSSWLESSQQQPQNEEYNDSFSNHRRPILRSLDGMVRFGTLNALMGTSGAGKTSLLRVLNGQSRTRLDDRCRFFLSKFVNITTCFITQEVSGHLWPGLTAKQLLMYASRLKNDTVGKVDAAQAESGNGGDGFGTSASSKQKLNHEALAWKWLDELHLRDTANTKVEHCSGGEQKRLALAIELIAVRMPNLICIDEPTSGLDSNSAEIVCRTLQNVCIRHSLCIIASIHQPNSALLAMFDQLYVLARGGVCVYSGAPSGILEHLERLDPSTINQVARFPIETLIQHSCGHYVSDSMVQRLAAQTTEHLRKVVLTEKCLNEDTQLMPDGLPRNRARFTFTTVGTLFSRYRDYWFGNVWYEWLAFCAIYIGYAAMLKTFYESNAMAQVSGCKSLEEDLNQTCTTSQDTIREDRLLRDNVMYDIFSVNIFSILVLLQFGLNMLREMRYFVNEHRNGWYSTGVWYTMKCCVDILPLIPALILYTYLLNIYESVLPGIYWQILTVQVLYAIASHAISHVIVMLAMPNITLINMISMGVTFSGLILGNFIIAYDRLHYVYQFLTNICPARFALEAVITLQYGFGRCSKKQIQPIMEWMSLRDEDYTQAILMLVINNIVYRLIAFFLLLRHVNADAANRKQRVHRLQDYRRKFLSYIGGITSSSPSSSPTATTSTPTKMIQFNGDLSTIESNGLRIKQLKL